MDRAWLKRVRPWQVVAWAALVVLLMLSVLNWRRPDVDEAAGRAILPLIALLIVDLVDQRRKGRSVPRTIGHGLLSVVALGVIFATFTGLQLLFGRPRDVDPFSESIDPAASYLAAIIVILLAWALVAKQFDLGPWHRKRGP